MNPRNCFGLSYIWGSRSISKEKIRFVIATEAYGVWWGRICNCYGRKRLELAPILGLGAESV